MRRLFSSSTAASGAKMLTLKNMNQSVVAAEYAVRGELAIRAEQLRSQLADKTSGTRLPFDGVISCNIGNPQQLGQPPISFFRQVASLVEYPALLDPSNRPIVNQLFPEDAIDRARRIVDSCGGNIGAYSHSQGIPAIRKNVAAFIKGIRWVNICAFRSITG
jgi:alanine transaminase